jgi:hypothetical protein
LHRDKDVIKFDQRFIASLAFLTQTGSLCQPLLSTPHLISCFSFRTNYFVQYFSAKMTAPRISRGTKNRVFLYIGVVIFVGITVVIIHETQTRMDSMQKISDKCQQQQESLAAQLQGKSCQK